MKVSASKNKKIDEGTMINCTSRSSSSSIRPWEDLSKDVLVSIYENLDLKDRLRGTLPCASWYTASKHPSLWNKICLPDFFNEQEEVGTRCSPRQLVECVVNRSQGLLMSIVFLPSNSVQDLLLVAERCPKLKHFHLKLKEHKRLISCVEVGNRKEMICTAISKLKELESMEVDDEFISKIILKTIAQNCPNFHKLMFINSTISSKTAFHIVECLPKLKALYLKSSDMHRSHLLAIFHGCLELEDVDICGCGKISVEDEILKIGHGRFKKFEWEREVMNECRDCEEWKGYYEWPCEHTYENGYIDGTREMIEELRPELFGGDYESDDNLGLWI